MKVVVKPFIAWAVVHGRTVFTDTIRYSKRLAINAYVAGADKGWTWKRLYASGARVIQVRVSIKALPSPEQRGET